MSAAILSAGLGASACGADRVSTVTTTSTSYSSPVLMQPVASATSSTTSTPTATDSTSHSTSVSTQSATPAMSATPQAHVSTVHVTTHTATASATVSPNSTATATDTVSVAKITTSATATSSSSSTFVSTNKYAQEFNCTTSFYPIVLDNDIYAFHCGNDKYVVNIAKYASKQVATDSPYRKELLKDGDGYQFDNWLVRATDQSIENLKAAYPATFPSSVEDRLRMS